MRRWLLSLTLLLGLLAPAAATLTTTNLSGFNAYRTAAPSTPATITFLQCTSSTTNATTYTFTSENTGTASADRVTVVGVTGEDAASVFTISSLTIGGDSATEQADYGGVAGITSSGVYSMANSAGTAEDIVVTFSEAVTGAAICVWQGNNFTSITATDTATGGNDAGTAVTLDLDVSADGVAVGVCATGNQNSTYTWTGMTERLDGGSSEYQTTAADYDEDSTASAPLAVTCDSTSGSGNGESGATAAFR